MLLACISMKMQVSLLVPFNQVGWTRIEGSVQGEAPSIWDQEAHPGGKLHRRMA